MPTDLSAGTYDIHRLWKEDRQAACALLEQFFEKFLPLYQAGELWDVEGLIRRMDRQNHTHGITGPDTSVWTAITVVIDDKGEVSEGRLSELYPHGVEMPTYDYAQNEHNRISSPLAAHVLAEIKDTTNKTHQDGTEAAYQNKSWRSVAEDFLGSAIELDPKIEAPEGYRRVPIEHKQPLEDGTYLPLALYWRVEGEKPLSVDDYRNIQKHVREYNKVLFAEFSDDPKSAEQDLNYQNEIHALEIQQGKVADMAQQDHTIARQATDVTLGINGIRAK